MADSLLTTDDTNSGSDDSNQSGVDQNLDMNNQGGAEDQTGKPDDKSGADDNADGKSTDGTDGKDDKGSDKGDSDGAPETYEQFTLPEGVEIHEDDLGKFQDIAKDLNLTQEQAQRLIDLQSERAVAAQEKLNGDIEAAFEKQQEDWIKELKEDTDFGGDNFDKNVGMAVKVINKFGGPDMKETLDTTGMGNNPALIRMLSKIGKAFSEDSLDDAGGGSTGSGKSVADKLYPSQAAAEG